MCTVALTLEIWPWVKAINTLGSWTTILWNIIQIQHGSYELWPGHGFLVCVDLDLDLGVLTQSRSWHTLGSWTTMVLNNIQIGQGSKKQWPGLGVNSRTDWQTDGRTDRQMDRQGDSYIPPKLCSRGRPIDRVIPIYPANFRGMTKESTKRMSSTYKRTRPIILYRATATLWRLQMNQYTASNEGGVATKQTEHLKILTKYEAVHLSNSYGGIFRTCIV